MLRDAEGQAMWAPGRERRRSRVTRQRVGDRPHTVTIAIALLGPLLSVAAVVISFNALSLNERSMKVGQRAYVSLSRGAVEDWFQRPPDDRAPDGADGLLTARASFSIDNLGNTPATIEHL